MQKSLLAGAVLWGVARLTHADETDCNQVSTIIKKYGNGTAITEAQATRYFMDKPKPAISIEVLKKALSSGPITAERLNELQTEEARHSAHVLVEVYGGGPQNNKFLTQEDLQKYLLATDPAFKKSCQPDLLTRISQDRLHVRNSALEVEKEQLPARFGWTHASDSGDSFQIDAALSYEPPPWKLTRDGHWYLYAKPAVEAHTSTLATAARDSISAKAPMEFVWGAGEKEFNDPNYLLKSLTMSVAPTFETDRKADTTNYGADIFVIPSIPKFAIGAPWHFGFIYPSWQPYIGLESGYVSGATGGLKSDTEFERFVLKLHGQVFITRYFELAVDYYHRTFLGSGPYASSDQTSFDYVEASGIFWFDPIDQHLSLGVSYKNGEAPPKFSSVNSVTAFLGIKF